MRKLVDPYLDGEELYRKYFEMGDGASYSTLAKFAVSSGMTSITYKNRFKLPRMGVWKAMWRWASLKENRELAYKIFSAYVFLYGCTWDTDFWWESGYKVTEQDWNRFMLKKIESAWQYPTESMLNRFLQKNGWL